MSLQRQGTTRSGSPGGSRGVIGTASTPGLLVEVEGSSVRTPSRHPIIESATADFKRTAGQRLAGAWTLIALTIIAR